MITLIARVLGLKTSANEPNCNTGDMTRRQVQLLTRAGCTICDGVHAQLKQLAEELEMGRA